MNGVHPTVRYLIPCKAVLVNASDPSQISLINLLSSIRATNDPPFPLRVPDFVLYVQLTECRGAGAIRQEITDAEEEHVLFQT